MRDAQLAHADVDVGGEATVEGDLPLAGHSPRLDGGVIQERQVHRLLELVSPLADEEHHSGVGLVHLRPRREPASAPEAAVRSTDASS